MVRLYAATAPSSSTTSPQLSLEGAFRRQLRRSCHPKAAPDDNFAAVVANRGAGPATSPQLRRRGRRTVGGMSEHRNGPAVPETAPLPQSEDEWRVLLRP